MASAKSVVNEAGEKLVKVNIPYMYNGNHTKFICHNGRTWLAKRGEDIYLPEKVAEMVEQSIAAEKEIQRKLDEASRKSFKF